MSPSLLSLLTILLVSTASAFTMPRSSTAASLRFSTHSSTLRPSFLRSSPSPDDGTPKPEEPWKYESKPFLIVPSPLALSVAVLFGILAASGAFQKGFVGATEAVIGSIVALASFILAIQNGQLETEKDDENFRQGR